MKKILLIACLLCSIGVLAQEKKKVAIATSISKSVPENVSETFMDAVEEGLVNSGKYEVYGNRAEFALSESEQQAFDEAGWVADEQKIDLGNADVVDCICVVKINKIEGNYSIGYKIQDRRSGGKIIASASMETENGSQDLMKVRRALIDAIVSGQQLSMQKKKLGALCPKCCIDGDGYMDCRISSNDERPMLWEEAVTFCNRKGEDWYLPAIDELQQIYDRQSDIVKDGGRRFQLTDYWSASKQNNYDAKVLDFRTGETTYASKSMSKKTFRCVRVQ
jgi:hypothetical protein